MAYMLWVKDGPSATHNSSKPDNDRWYSILEAWHSGGVQKFATADAARKQGQQDVRQGYLDYLITPYDSERGWDGPDILNGPADGIK
jgi:hypothetical protein